MASQKTTRKATLLRMLRRAKGATMGELRSVLQIQKHSIRAMISMARKEHDLTITLDDGRYRAEG